MDGEEERGEERRVEEEEESLKVRTQRRERCDAMQ
jgi:hypothetical protein